MTQVKNVNKVVGAIRAGIVKRMKKMGLTGVALEKALQAVRGDVVESGKDLKLSAQFRKKLMDHVHANGPIVITGKTSLKIFSLKSYEIMRATSRASANKHAPWNHAKVAKKAAQEALPA